MAETFPVSDEECEYAGHYWAPAGGGLLICAACGAEQWDDELAPVSELPKEGDAERLCGCGDEITDERDGEGATQCWICAADDPKEG